MPPRWLAVLIVVAWLVLTGWLLHHELLPRLMPGQAPPFSIDFVEEAQTKRASIAWTVLQNDREVGVARTRIEHPRHDRFELIAEFPFKGREFYARLATAVVGSGSESPLALLVAARCAVAMHTSEGERNRPNYLPVSGLHILALSSVYHVNGNGDLLGFQARFEAMPQALAEANPGALWGSAAITGEVSGGRLTLTRELSRAGGSPIRGTALADLGGTGGSVIMPLHPPKRVRGLKPGQSWTAIVLDPFAYYLVAGEPPVARAKVRGELEPFSWGRRAEVPCLVIDYEGDRLKVSTWVSSEDGTVLCQEATLDRTRWVMYRN